MFATQSNILKSPLDITLIDYPIRSPTSSQLCIAYAKRCSRY